VGCGLWDADGDGMCVGDGSVMDVRIKNERERESMFISISHVQKTYTWDMEMNMDSRSRSFPPIQSEWIIFQKKLILKKLRISQVGNPH